MPAGSRGPRGFRDWQRESPFDQSPVFVSDKVSARTGNLEVGPFECSRFAYLIGGMEAFGAPVLFTATWHADEAGVQLIARRKYMLEPEILSQDFLHIPHLGPWFRLTWEPLEAATKWKLEAHLLNSTRVYALEHVPSQPVLINVTPVFAGVETKLFYPASYYAGPMRAVVSNSAAVLTTAALQAEVAPGEWTLVDYLPNAGGGPVAATFIAPPGAWRVAAESTGAVTTAYRLTPSTTGAT